AAPASRSAISTRTSTWRWDRNTRRPPTSTPTPASVSTRPLPGRASCPPSGSIQLRLTCITLPLSPGWTWCTGLGGAAPPPRPLLLAQIRASTGAHHQSPTSAHQCQALLFAKQRDLLLILASRCQLDRTKSCSHRSQWLTGEC